jgi:serine/threonine protein kinase
MAAVQSDPWGQRRLMALKVFEHPVAPEALERALTCHRRMATLSHRHLLPCTGLARVGEHVALARPWVEGIDLLDWVEILKETGVEMPGRVLCEVLRSVAVALDAALCRVPQGDAHPLGIVHRDLKPTNVLVTRDGEVKVVDFAAGYTALAPRDARTGALRNGLTKYLAPERREGVEGGPAADVYALGILGIELFRRRWLRRLRSSNPAHDRHLAEVVAAMDDPDMRSQADTRALRTLLLRMVAYDPEHRPAAVEVAQTLRTLADRAPGASLESFAHDHALPYVEPPVPREADRVDAHPIEIDELTADPRPPELTTEEAADPADGSVDGSGGEESDDDLASRAVHGELEAPSAIIESYTEQAIEATRRKRSEAWKAKAALAPPLPPEPIVQRSSGAPHVVGMLVAAVGSAAMVLVLLVAVVLGLFVAL